MEKFQADIIAEDGTTLIRNLDVWLVDVRHPNGFNRDWRGTFKLKGDARRRIDISGRYYLHLADGRSGEFLITRIKPNLLEQTADLKIVFSGDIS